VPAEYFTTRASVEIVSEAAGDCDTDGTAAVRRWIHVRRFPAPGDRIGVGPGTPDDGSLAGSLESPHEGPAPW